MKPEACARTTVRLKGAAGYRNVFRSRSFQMRAATHDPTPQLALIDGDPVVFDDDDGVSDGASIHCRVKIL